MNSIDYSSRENQNIIYKKIKDSKEKAVEFINDVNAILELSVNDSKLKEAVNLYKDNEFRKRASKVSVGEINKDRVGIRISVLENAGYRNLYQLYCASPQQLLSIHGIGEGNARLIINKTNEICNRIKSGISIDPKTNNTQDMAVIVLEAYKYLKLSQLKNRVTHLLGEVLSATKAAYNSGINSSEVFLYINRRKKSIAYLNALYIDALLTDKVCTILKDAKKSRKKIENTTRKDAWSDYLKNSATYVSCIARGTKGKVEVEDLEKYRKITPISKNEITISEHEQNILNCPFVKTHKGISIAALAVIVLLIGGIIVNSIGSAISQKKAAEEQTKKAKANFESSIENPISWVNFTFDNNLNLGIEKTETTFTGYDNYIKEDSNIIITASINSSPTGYENEISECDTVVILDEKKYGCEVAVGKTVTDAGEYIEKYRIKTYRSYLISAKSEDKNAMASFEQMIESMKFDSVAEKDDENAMIKAAEEAKRAEEAAKKEAYDALPDAPYHFMSELDINDTKLGKYDECEKYEDNYYEEHKSKKYIWYDKEDRIEFEAVVRWNKNEVKEWPERYVSIATKHVYNSDGTTMDIEMFATDADCFSSLDELKSWYIDHWRAGFNDEDIHDFWEYVNDR